MRHAEFGEPRLVEVYDADFGWSVDNDFFLSVVRDLPADRAATLRPAPDELHRSLAATGFHIDAVYGGWRQPVGHPDGELLVLAHTS